MEPDKDTIKDNKYLRGEVREGDEKIIALEKELEDTKKKLVEAEEPDYAINYIPKDDSQGRRHTSWFKWVTATKPPEDFGQILNIRKIKK